MRVGEIWKRKNIPTFLVRIAMMNIDTEVENGTVMMLISINGDECVPAGFAFLMYKKDFLRQFEKDYDESPVIDAFV